MTTEEILEKYFPYVVQVSDLHLAVEEFDNILNKIFTSFNWKEEAFLLPSENTIEHWGFEKGWNFKGLLMDNPDLLTEINLLVSIKPPELFRFKTEQDAILAKLLFL
jgi:hypothetical protein